MRVLMLTSDVSMQCGIARHVLAISSEMVKRPGVEVAVCTVYPRGELTKELEAAGVKTYELNAATGHDLKCLWGFHRIVKDFKPDVVHIHMLALMERAYFSWYCRTIPLVATTHGISDINTGLRKVTMRDRLESWLTKITPIHSVQRVYISEGVRMFNKARNGFVVYNPMQFVDVACERNAGIRGELELDGDTKLIGTACRIASQKNPRAFVEVMCRVLTKMASVHALVCGTTEDKQLADGLKEIVRNFGVDDRFHWLGYRQDAADITQQLDCFVMTSVSEGMPTALLEAMSVKTPIAFMRGKGGLVDLDLLDKREGPIGVVVDAGDKIGMFERIVDLLNRPELAKEYADRAFEVGKRHFDVKSVVDKLLGIYGEAIER